MVDFVLERELRGYLALLGPSEQRELLDYARALRERSRHGVAGRSLLRFAGSIPLEDVASIARAVGEGCERVDPDAG